MINTILEMMYIFCGIVLIVCGIYAFYDKGNSKKIGSALFWILFGILFMAGPYLNKALVGAILLVMGVLTATKNVKAGSLINSSEEFRKARAKEIGNKIFIPAISVGVGAFAVAQFTTLGGLVGLGIGALIALILTIIVTKEKPKYIPYDSSRLLQQIRIYVLFGECEWRQCYSQGIL